MAFSPGSDGTIKGNNADSSYVKIAGINSVDFTKNRQAIDVTELGDTFDDVIMGLMGADVTLSGAYDIADTQTALIVSQFQGTGEYWVEVKPNGTAGFTMQTRILSINYTNAIGSTPAQFSVKLKGIAIWTAV